MITSSRFVVDDELKLRTFLEESRPVSKNSEDLEFSNTFLYWVPDIFKDFALPAGFPGDYIRIFSFVSCFEPSYSFI